MASVPSPKGPRRFPPPKTSGEADAQEAKRCKNVIQAACSNLEGAVRHFVRKDPTCVKKKDEDGKTALHWAAFNGHDSNLELLLNSGSDSAAKSSKGWTALHYAAANGHGSTVERLLTSKADVEAKNNGGKMPVDMAKTEEVSALLRKAIEVIHTSHSALDLEAEVARCSSVLDAAESGLLKATEHFLRRDPKCIEMKDVEGGTALHVASEHGHTFVVETLLSQRAVLEAKDDYGLTALHLAASCGHVRTVQLLARHGAILNVKENHGLTPAKLAKQEGYHQVESMLEELEAASNKEEQADAEEAAKCPGGIIQAARDGLAGAARHFVKHDPASMQKKARFGKTALHLAAEEGHDSILQMFLSLGANVDSKTTNGLTALHLAAANGHAHVVEILMSHGATADVKGNNGKTPAHMAAESGHKKVADLLWSDYAGHVAGESSENRHRAESQHEEDSQPSQPAHSFCGLGGSVEPNETRPRPSRSAYETSGTTKAPASQEVQETHVARSVTFTTKREDVIQLRLEGGQVNKYTNGELERSNLILFYIDITWRTYRDDGADGGFKDDADVEALKASVEGLFAEALRGGELRQRWVQKVKKEWWALEEAPEAVRGDHEVVLAAVKAKPSALEYASERLRGDRSCVLELVRATKAAFLTAWAAEELWSDDAFVAQCRAAVPSGLVWTWYGSSSAPVAMRRSFPTAGASIPGGEAYDHVMEKLKGAEHGSTATVWFGDTPVWGHQANKKQWIHPPHACGRHHQPVPPPEGRHPMWDAKIESRSGDEEAEVGSTHPCWCCAWIQEVQKKAAEGNIICCAVSNIYDDDWVEKYGARSSELSDARAEEFGLRKETFRNGRPDGWGEAVIEIDGFEFSREAPVHPRTNLPLGEGCRWERQTLDRMDFPVYAFFQP